MRDDFGVLQNLPTKEERSQEQIMVVCLFKKAKREYVKTYHTRKRKVLCIIPGTLSTKKRSRTAYSLAKLLYVRRN